MAMSQQWYYAKGEQQNGPISTESLTALARSGRVKPTDLVWTDGMSDWKRADSVSEFFPPELPRTGPPPIPTRPLRATLSEGHETGNKSSKRIIPGQPSTLRASLSSMTTAAGEKLRQVQDHQAVEDAVRFAFSLKERLA